jgi:signal transduction histidine kinase
VFGSGALRLHWSNRISFKLARTSVIIAFVVGVALSGGQVYLDYFEEIELFDDKVNQSLEVAKNASTRAVFILDDTLANEVITGLLKYDYISEVKILDDDGRVLAEGSQETRMKDSPFEFAYLFFEKTVNDSADLELPEASASGPGKLVLEVDKAVGLQPFFARAVTTFLTGIVRNLLLVMLLYISFYKELTKPLNEIVQQLADISPEQPGEKRIKLKPAFDHDELGLLARQINMSFDAIQQLLDNLRSTNTALASSEEALRRRSLELEHEIVRTIETTKQLVETKEEAEAANRAKSAFLANVSHELRTPLNAIIGFSSIMAEQMFGPIGHDKYKEYLNDIRSSSEHLSDVLGEVLDLAKIEAGQLKIENEHVDMAALCEESCSLVTGQAVVRGFNVTSRVEDNIPMVKGDRLRIKQAVLNLLSNAVKFTPQDGKNVELHTYISADNSELIVSVKDYGIGIPEEEHELIFSPFMRSASALSRSHEGTGLGLSLVKAFMDMHDGHINLQSGVGEGTVITLHFPVSRFI